MKDEALRMALEALENSVDLVREDAYNAEKLYGNYPSRQGKVNGLKVLADDHEKAITVIKQALAAQQEHEPENEPFVSLASVQEPVQATMKLESSGPGYGPAPKQKLSVRHVSLIDAGKTPPVQPAVPDALNPKDENPAYAAGWNDCRAEMLKGNTP